jgi:hypothetical protein
MLGSMKMFGSVFVFGGIAAADVAAGEAHPQMDPGVSRLQTFLATVCARCHVLDFLDVRTGFLHFHRFLLRVRLAGLAQFLLYHTADETTSFSRTLIPANFLDR